jgi:hypothetical protein
VGPAAKFGINKVPAFLYFEDNIPTVYDEDPTDHKAIVEWIEEQRTSDAIEVDQYILENFISWSLTITTNSLGSFCPSIAFCLQEGQNIPDWST